MNRPTSEVKSRFRFKEYAGQRPSLLSWFSVSQAKPRLKWDCSRDTPACCSTNVIKPVAYPSLFVSSGVPSVRFQAPTRDDRLHPPSSCCLLHISSMSERFRSALRRPGSLDEAHSTKERLIGDCLSYSRWR